MYNMISILRCKWPDSKKQKQKRLRKPNFALFFFIPSANHINRLIDEIINYSLPINRFQIVERRPALINDYRVHVYG